jgi:hypothetical protein
VPGPSPWLFVPSPKLLLLLHGDTSESSCSAPDQRDRSRFRDNASLVPGACAELLQPGQWQGQAFIYTHGHTRPRGVALARGSSPRTPLSPLTNQTPRCQAVSCQPAATTVDGSRVGSPASVSACTVDFRDGAREAAIARSLWALACPAGCPRWPRGRRLASRWRRPRLDTCDCLVCRQLDNRDVAASSDRGLWANKACFGKAKKGKIKRDNDG